MSKVIKQMQMDALKATFKDVKDLVVLSIKGVNSQAEGGWTLMAYIFTAILLLITIAGSLWIMYHLNSNMMPGMPAGQAVNTP